jgi:hypothetical protein
LADRYFSPAEVEALIPALTELMERVMAGHREAGAVRERMHAEQRRIMLVGGAVLDREAWRAERQRLERLVEQTQEALNEILALGGVPKDLELGLVDFPHLRRGQEVNLCWKRGEHEIRYWHGLDEGYAARKPL